MVTEIPRTRRAAARSRVHDCVHRLLDACARHVDGDDLQCVTRVIEELKRLLPASAGGGKLTLLLRHWIKRHPIYWTMTPGARHVVDRVIASADRSPDSGGSRASRT